MKITIIDDNVRLSQSIKKFYEKRWTTVRVHNSRQEFMSSDDIHSDVYLIDIDLQDGNGLDITRHLRNIEKLTCPILMISGEQGLHTKLEGFDVWADDYIVKPFSPLELDARVKTILSRMQSPISKELTYKNIHFDPQTRRLTLDENEIDLSKKEKQIIELFIENKWIFISKDKLRLSVWWNEYDPDNIQNTMNVSLCKVRKKLWDSFNLVTINSEGYILED